MCIINVSDAFFPEKKPPEVLPTGLTQGSVCQDSCACTRFFCMHNTLVHAQRFVLGPSLGPWPLQCMHKSVANAQECCACTRILCMHKNLVHAQYTLLSLHNNKYCSETFPYQRSDFRVHFSYIVD